MTEPTPEAAEARLSDAELTELENLCVHAKKESKRTGWLPTDYVIESNNAMPHLLAYIRVLLAEVARLTAERDAFYASLSDTCDLVGVVCADRDRLREALEMAYTVLKDDPAAQFTARLVRAALAGPPPADAGADGEA